MTTYEGDTMKTEKLITVTFTNEEFDNVRNALINNWGHWKDSAREDSSEYAASVKREIAEQNWELFDRMTKILLAL